MTDYESAVEQPSQTIQPAEEYQTTETHYQALEPEELEATPCASLSARFGAFLIDISLIAYICYIGYGLFQGKLGLPSYNLDNWRSVSNLTLLGAAAIAFFLYFFLFEGVLARTPGKILCGIAVADRNGEPPSLMGILIRNLLRFVDLILFPLTGLGLAEITTKRQRLGDIIGGTTVRRMRRPGHPVRPPDEVVWGSITGRCLALILDLALFALTALFFLLALPTQHETLTRWVLLSGPLLVVGYWVLCDIALGGTPGKLLFGLRVVDDQARPIGVAGSLVRNLFRILDHNPLGYLCAVLAARKQRPGDLAAQSAVIRTGWSLRSFFSLLIFVAVVLGIGYYGMHNPNNFIRTDQVIKVGPWTVPDVPSQFKYWLGLRLNVSDFHFGKAGRPALAEEPLYSPGEIVYLTAEVQGFLMQDQTAWLQEDILVTGPDGAPLIDLLNVINKRFEVGHTNSQVLESSFLLPLRIEAGPYSVRVRIRDRNGNMFGSAEKTFMVQ